MTPLLNWRNRIVDDGRCQRAVRLLSTELALGLLTVTSIVETVAYAALTFISLLFSPITERPYQFFLKLLQSSSFTIGWAAVDLFFQFISENLHNNEVNARSFVNENSSIRALRAEDENYLEGLAGLIHDCPKFLLLKQGIDFIKNNVLRGATDKTKERFKEVDPEIVPFILTKAVFIYAAGSKATEVIPGFFSQESQREIAKIRTSEPKGEEIEQFFKSPGDFEQARHPVLAQLKNVALSYEMGGYFFKECWFAASQYF